MKKLVTALLVILLAGCSDIKITNQWDQEVDFSTFNTYSLYPWNTHNSLIINDYDKQTILTAIKQEMNDRGYKEVEKNGDLVVSAFVIIENKTSYDAYTTHYGGWAGYGGGWGYGYGAGYYGYRTGYSSTTVTRNDYQKGTLIIDVFRLSDKRLIWQGIGSGEVTTDLDKRDRRLPTSISNIFNRYPLKKTKSNKK